MEISVIIPAYNEEGNVVLLFEKIKKALVKYDYEVIFIDDGSTDNTFDIAKKAGAVVLRHRVNLGKGAALKTGCDASGRADSGGDFIDYLARSSLVYAVPYSGKWFDIGSEEELEKARRTFR